MLIDILSGVAGAYLDVSGTWGFPTWLWILFLIIGLLLAPFLAFHKVRLKSEEIRIELDKLKNERPKIETIIRHQNDDFNIEVLNEGEDAECEAQIEVFDGKGFVLSLPQNYSAYWEKTKNDKTKLKKGQRDWLKIASLEINHRALIMSYRLHYYEIMHFENSTFPRIAYAGSTSWIPGNTQIVKPCISLRITISTNPSMIAGAFVRSYQLSDNGLVEINSS